MKSLSALNVHTVPSRQRGETESSKVLRTGTHLHYWDQIERQIHWKFGTAAGREVFNGFVRSEDDPEFASLFLLGVSMLDWQLDTWNDLESAPIVVGRLSNSGGKTVHYTLLHLIAAGIRKWAAPTWGLYRTIHFGPRESHALEAKIKMDEILSGRAREQWDDKAQEFRPAMLRYFVKPVKFGPHHGYTYFEYRDKKNAQNDFVSATTAFMPTAGKGESGDGTDPMLMTLDEGRHERNLTRIFYRIWVPRTLRTPGARIDLEYTPMEASPELEAILEQAKADTKGDFKAHELGLAEANDRLRPEDVERVKRVLSVHGKHMVEQVIGGKATQPEGARFSQASVAAAFYAPPTPPWLSTLAGTRARITARCPKCQAGLAGDVAAADGHPVMHQMVGALDPASSAPMADDTVFTAWDLDPPLQAADGLALPAEVVYIEVMEPGTPIQDVAAHLSALWKEIKGPCGYDRKSAIGHNVEDLVVALEPEGEFVPVQWNTAGEKDRDLDFFSGLVDRGYWRSPWHIQTRTQMMNYVRNDRHIATDFLMAQVVAARVAQPYLPFYVDGADDRWPSDGEVTRYAGFGDGHQPIPDVDRYTSGFDPLRGGR